MNKNTKNKKEDIKSKNMQTGLYLTLVAIIFCGGFFIKMIIFKS
jgi:hypothetical protein